MDLDILSEDMDEFKRSFPGAYEFLVSARARFKAYKKAMVLTVDNARFDEIFGDKACDEKWFVDKCKKDGVYVPKDLKEKHSKKPKKKPKKSKKK